MAGKNDKGKKDRQKRQAKKPETRLVCLEEEFQTKAICNCELHVCVQADKMGDCEPNKGNLKREGARF